MRGGERAPAGSPGSRTGSVADHLGLEPGTLADQGRDAAQNLANQPQPFTPAWYAQHPNAWHVTHPYANEAALVATTAAVTAWLTTPYRVATPTTVSSTSSYPVPVETSSAPVAGVPAEEQTDQPADQGAPAGPAPEDAANWMDLGVFTLVPASSGPATRMFQLAVHHDGTLRGSLYDRLTESVTPLAGKVDDETLQATWSAEGTAGGAQFAEAVQHLTQPQGVVTVTLSDGTEIRYTTQRMQ